MSQNHIHTPGVSENPIAEVFVEVSDAVLKFLWESDFSRRQRRHDGTLLAFTEVYLPGQPIVARSCK